MQSRNFVCMVNNFKSTPKEPVVFEANVSTCASESVSDHESDPSSSLGKHLVKRNGVQWKYLDGASFQDHDDISWNFFKLGDSDVCVKMSEKCSSIGNGKVQFEFVKEQNVNWWKGMKVDKSCGDDQ